MNGDNNKEVLNAYNDKNVSASELLDIMSKGKAKVSPDNLISPEQVASVVKQKLAARENTSTVQQDINHNQPQKKSAEEIKKAAAAMGIDIGEIHVDENIKHQGTVENVKENEHTQETEDEER